MLEASFDIELEQAVIISQQAASAGAHQCLDFIPGSVLLGLAASRLYADLDSESAWTLFHSGQVRYSDALPLGACDETGYPVPLCWHAYKGEQWKQGGRLLAESLFDPSREKGDETRQPKQLRDGYTTVSGEAFKPKHLQTLKTAIDPGTGRAAESQLFGYEMLAPGQRFRCTVSADDSVPTELWQRLQHAFVGAARLGRSRSAQFGSVNISACGAVSSRAAGAPVQGELTLWLLSDMYLEDQGQPCLIPHPELLGLPAGSRWLSDRSFLRSRRYSVFNAYRRHFDSERQVICRGSVLRYSLPRPLTADERAALGLGVGLHLESGLGAVWVDPPLLESARPRFAKAPVQAVTAQTKLVAPDSVLISVLGQRLARRTGDIAPEEAARKLFKDLCARVREARRYAAVAAGVCIEGAPGRSQWGRLKQLSSDFRNNPGGLLIALIDSNDGAIRERSGWELRYGPQPHEQLYKWLAAELKVLADHVDLGRLVGHLAVLGLQQAWLDCCAGANSMEHAE